MVDEVERQVVEIFSEIYPHWVVEDGACLNCTELYTAYRQTFARARPLWHAQPTQEGVVEEMIFCTLCGYEVPPEDFLFHRRIEEVLLNRLESNPSEGSRDNMTRPHCMGEVARIVAASVAESTASVEENS